MTEAQAIELVTQRFLDAWPAASGAVPYALPNEARLSADTFVQLSILPYTGRTLTQGPGALCQQWRYAVIAIYVPCNTGTQLANQIADAAKLVYQRQTLTSGGEEVTFDVSVPRAIAAALDGRWYVTASQTLFYWFETAAA